MMLGSGIMSSTTVVAVKISNPYVTTAIAFLFCLIAAYVIVGVSRFRGTSPAIMVLADIPLVTFYGPYHAVTVLCR